MRCPTARKMHPTVQVFLAGGVPEVMLHLRRAGLLDTGVLTVSGETLGRRARLVGAIRTPRGPARACCASATASTPTTSSWTPMARRRRGLTSTVTFPMGNLAPGGSVIKSTAIDPSVVDADGVYRKTGPARVFLTETGRHRRHQEQGPDASRPATCWC